MVDYIPGRQETKQFCKTCFKLNIKTCIKLNIIPPWPFRSEVLTLKTLIFSVTRFKWNKWHLFKFEFQVNNKNYLVFHKPVSEPSIYQLMPRQIQYCMRHACTVKNIVNLWFTFNQEYYVLLRSCLSSYTGISLKIALGFRSLCLPRYLLNSPNLHYCYSWALQSCNITSWGAEIYSLIPWLWVQSYSLLWPTKKQGRHNNAILKCEQ